MSEKKHHLRETPEDKRKERKILDALAAHLDAEVQQVETFGKYKIDGILHRASEVVAFVECKWLDKEGFYGINLPKYVEGIGLATHGGAPFIYAVRTPGKFGYAVIHDGVWAVGDLKSVWTGGFRNPPNWDDKEPMMMIQPEKMLWVDVSATK